MTRRPGAARSYVGVMRWGSAQHRSKSRSREDKAQVGLWLHFGRAQLLCLRWMGDTNSTQPADAETVFVEESVGVPVASHDEPVGWGQAIRSDWRRVGLPRPTVAE